LGSVTAIGHFHLQADYISFTIPLSDQVKYYCSVKNVMLPDGSRPAIVGWFDNSTQIII